jgi:hypothetical protein
MTENLTNTDLPDAGSMGPSAFDLSKVAKPLHDNSVPAVGVRYNTTHVSRQELSNDTAVLKLEVLRLRDELIGALAREGEARARLAALINGAARRSEHQGIKNHENVVAYNRQLEDQIDTILHSRTWRIGAFLLKPVKPIRKIIRSRG